MNTVVPQAWIIQEKKRREEERRKNENESNSIPISLPKDQPDSEYPEHGEPAQENTPKRTVIIIEL